MNLPLTNADRSRDRRACAVPPWGCPWPRQPAAALQRAASPVLARANTLSSGRPTSGDAADAPHTEPFRRYRQNGQRRGPETRYLQVIRERSGAGVEPTNRWVTTACRFEGRTGLALRDALRGVCALDSALDELSARLALRGSMESPAPGRQIWEQSPCFFTAASALQRGLR